MKRLGTFVGGSLLILLAACSAAGTPSVGAQSAPSTVTTTATAAGTVTKTVTSTVTVTPSPGDVQGGGPGGGIPAGFPPSADFYDYGNGVYAAFETNHDLFDCASGDNVCWGVKVASLNGCPNGVKVKLTVYAKGTTNVLSTIDQSDSTALAPLGTTMIVMGSGQVTGETPTEAEITEASCA